MPAKPASAAKKSHYQRIRPVEVENPLRQARKVCRLTIDQVVLKTGLSKSYIIKQEQGTYEEPSELLLNFYLSILGPYKFWRVEARKKYRAFQSAVRIANYGVLKEPFPLKKYLSTLNDKKTVQHPLEFWREVSHHAKGQHPNLNLISKSLCIQQALLYKFEHQAHLVNSVPEPLIHALLEAGYSSETISGFDLAFHEYKRYLRNQVVVTSAESS